MCACANSATCAFSRFSPASSARCDHPVRPLPPPAQPSRLPRSDPSTHPTPGAPAVSPSSSCPHTRRSSIPADYPRPLPRRSARAISHVSRARCIGLVYTAANRSPRKNSRSAPARRRPSSVSGISVRPVCAPLRLHAVSPCRISQSSVPVLIAPSTSAHPSL